MTERKRNESHYLRAVELLIDVAVAMRDTNRVPAHQQFEILAFLTEEGIDTAKMEASDG